MEHWNRNDGFGRTVSSRQNATSHIIHKMKSNGKTMKRLSKGGQNRREKRMPIPAVTMA